MILLFIKATETGHVRQGIFMQFYSFKMVTCIAYVAMLHVACIHIHTIFSTSYLQIHKREMQTLTVFMRQIRDRETRTKVIVRRSCCGLLYPGIIRMQPPYNQRKGTFSPEVKVISWRTRNAMALFRHYCISRIDELCMRRISFWISSDLLIDATGNRHNIPITKHADTFL